MLCQNLKRLVLTIWLGAARQIINSNSNKLLFHQKSIKMIIRLMSKWRNKSSHNLISTSTLPPLVKFTHQAFILDI